MPPKKSSRKRKGDIKRSSKRPNRTVSIDEDDGTQVEESATPSRQRKAKSLKPDKRRPNLDSPVTLNQLRKFCIDTMKAGVPGLLTQFLELKAATAPPPLKAIFDANAERNRYRDVICPDKTRVILKWPANAPSDYIHANWVDFKGEKKFICTQAPIEATVDDFWRLVWQERCKAIVMLCELVEQNKKKCEAYWPAEVNGTMNTKSGLLIKNSQIIQLENTLTVSSIEISCPTDAAAETLSLKHMKWNNWPDRGVPENRMAPFRLLGRLNTVEPVLIHCSAGIGRTGTIVGLHMALQVLAAGEDLVLANVVKELRAQRHGSVQTDTQYVYMHRTLINLAENKSVVTAEEVDKFSKEYEAFIKSRGG